MDKEIWLPVVGFDGYQVSSYGRVRGVRGRLLKPHPNYGYPLVKLSKNGRSFARRIYRLVCEAFHGPKPSPSHQVAHADGVRENNYYLNLRWATPRENTGDKKLHGTQLCGSKIPIAKLTETDIPEILRLANAGWKQPAIGKLFGVHRTVIGEIIMGRIWKHVPRSLPQGARVSIAARTAERENLE